MADEVDMDALAHIVPGRSSFPQKSKRRHGEFEPGARCYAIYAGNELTKLSSHCILCIDALPWFYPASNFSLPGNKHLKMSSTLFS